MNPSPEHRTVEDILSLPNILGCIKFTLTSLHCCGPCAFYQALFELGLTVVYACRVLVSHGCILVWVQNLRRLPGQAHIFPTQPPTGMGRLTVTSYQNIAGCCLHCCCYCCQEHTVLPFFSADLILIPEFEYLPIPIQIAVPRLKHLQTVAVEGCLMLYYCRFMVLCKLHLHRNLGDKKYGDCWVSFMNCLITN